MVRDRDAPLNRSGPDLTLPAREDESQPLVSNLQPLVSSLLTKRPLAPSDRCARKRSS